MSSYEFIFSNKFSHRLSRHLVFWIAFALHIFLFRYYVYDLKYLFLASTYVIRLENLLLFLPISIFYAYFSMYFLLPRYILKEKYFILLIIIVALSVLLAYFSYLISNHFNIRFSWDIPFKRTTVIRRLDFMVSSGLVYPLTASASAIAIKMAKNFYTTQLENERLAKQKITSEISLLKSQIHPRFLFHSLNSIYSDMLNGSERSPDMVLKLSDLLSYILYESDHKMVPLEKELALLKNYIDLELESEDNNLLITENNQIDPGQKQIAPLLLLQITEYIFEQAEEFKNEQVIIDINTTLTENKFLLIISMNRFTQNNTELKKQAIQLLEIEKRLQILYPKKFNLTLTGDKKNISISLFLHLEELVPETEIVKQLE